MLTKWRKAIEHTLDDENEGGSGFCEVLGCYRCCIINYCNGTSLRSWYGQDNNGYVDYSNRKHFWAEFALSNPSLGVDESLIFERSEE